MQTIINSTIPAVSEIGGIAQLHAESKDRRSGQFFDLDRNRHDNPLRGEISKIGSDGIAVIRLPNKDIQLKLPPAFSVGDILYGIISPGDAWTVYAIPSTIIRKNTPEAILEVFNFPQNSLIQVSIQALADYIPIVSKGDISAFAYAVETICTQFNLPESNAVGLAVDLHRHGVALNMQSIQKAIPSVMSQSEFYNLITKLADSLEGQYLPFRDRIETMLSAVADPLRDVRDKIKFFMIGKTGGRDSSLFGLLAELLRAEPPHNAAAIAQSLIKTIESRYFMNLCALAAGLPMRFWVASDRNMTTEIAIQRTQKEHAAHYSVSLSVESEALGLIGIHLSSFEQAITARFYAENNSSRDILAEYADEFAHSLESAGYKQSSVGITTGSMPIITPNRNGIRLTI